jgi:hypothetical protein
MSDGSGPLSDSTSTEPVFDGGSSEIVPVTAGDAGAYAFFDGAVALLDVAVQTPPLDAGDENHAMPLDATSFQQGPYARPIFEGPTDYRAAQGGAWLTADYDRDGIPDLVFIKNENTATNKVEVHVSSGVSRYQTRIYDSGTVFGLEPVSNGVWRMVDQDIDGSPDLAFIKTANTGTGKIEVHIASGASKYQTFLVQTGTRYSLETDGTWLFADYDRDLMPDLVFIKTANTGTGKVEVHIASGSSKYQTILLETGTVFPLETDGTWLMADYDRDGVPDLVFIKTSNVASGKVEVNVASGASKYQTAILQAVSMFDSDSSATWLMASYDQDGIPDLICVKGENTATGMAEISIASSKP